MSKVLQYHLSLISKSRKARHEYFVINCLKKTPTRLFPLSSPLSPKKNMARNLLERYCFNRLHDNDQKRNKHIKRQ